MIEVLFSIAIAATAAATAVPQGLRTLDEFRTRTAARYLASLVIDARFRAVSRGMAAGLRFEPDSTDYRVSVVVDGNDNGLRTSELQSGVDTTLGAAERLSGHFAGVMFGLLPGVPDADGQAVTDPDGVRLGASKLLSMNPDGTASSGTLYVHGHDRSQYAVRVLGVTGRVRLLKFDFVKGKWGDV